MNDILVIGHRNPDTDSICAAHGYARLKNTIDPHNRYRSGRCGSLNSQTRFALERFGIRPPEFVQDVYPRVRDVMTRQVVSIEEHAPVFGVVRNIEERRIRLTPVVSDTGLFRGVVSILEMSRMLHTSEVERRPTYRFRGENFTRVIEGFLHRTGEQEEFEASVMIGAMPFDRCRSRLEQNDPERTVLVVGKRRDIVEYALERQLPALVLTGIEGAADLDFDFSGYRGWVFVSEMDTAETLRRLLLSVPTHSIMNREVSSVNAGEYLDRAGEILLEMNHRGLPVVEDGRLQGLLTRSDLIKKVRNRLILVDHNELDQAVEGAESAEIVEIVDHHRLATIRTRTPIHFLARPVGSTCTLVFQQYRQHQVELDPATAGLLLSGVLSDTVILKSPTTTAEDTAAAEQLAAAAGVDLEDFGMELFSAAESLKGRDAEEIVGADFKTYEEFGTRFGIGQVEVVTLGELDEVASDLKQALANVRAEGGLDWAMLLVTDIIRTESILLTTSFAPAEKRLAYRQTEPGRFALPGVLSRKKQLLPEIFRVLEELEEG